MEKKKTVSDFSDHNPKNRQEETRSRRQFLKKAAYSAPAIVSLGYMMRPVNTMAGDSQTLDTDPRYTHPDDFW
jgi:hypothetical protein